MRDTQRYAAGPASEPKRCAVYTRKSTSAGLEQEFNSLDAQFEACAAYVARQPGWSLLPDRYDDGGFTGANTDRPAFQRLAADVDAGKVDVVVVYKVDRLSRSLLDFARVMERFNASGASFVSVTQNFSTADAMGRLTLNMLMSFAEFEREMIGERTRDKIAASRRRGKWTGGTVLIGYDTTDKRLVVNQLEAVVVREVFDLYLEHRSALAVATLLNNRGRATKSHTSKKGKVRAARPWTVTDVLRVLRCPVYAGYMRSGKTLHDSEHEAIVERETFARAQAILDGASPQTRSPGRNPNYVLAGILHCACCGSAFTPASTKKKGKTFRYYRCVTRDKRGKDACPSAPLPAGAIEGYVVDRLRDAIAEGSLAEDVTAAVKQRVAARRKDLAVERRRIPVEIAALSTEGKRLVDTLGEMKASARPLVERRLQEIGEQIARCEARQAAVAREIGALDAAEVEAGWVAQVLADFTAVWDVLTPENRGRLLRAVVQSVEVDEPANKVKVAMVDLASGLREAVA